MAKITMDKVAESAVGYPSQQGTLEYNGQVQTPTWDVFYEPQKMIVTGETSGTNAGTYTITMTPKPTYYWWDTGTTTARTQTWKINRAKINAVPSQSGTILYDGTPKSPTWNNYDPDKMTMGGTTTATNAGIYTATFTPKSNYQWADGTTATKNVTWEIASEMVAVPSVIGGMHYNGSVQSPAISPYDTNTIAASGDLSGTNAGTYTITFSLKTPNSKWTDGTNTDKLVTWKILPKIVDIPTVTDTNKTYNGSAQAPTVSSYSSDEITVSGTTSATNAGDYTIRFNLVSKINYVWNDSTTTEKAFSWKIAKAAGSLTLSNYSVTLYKTTPAYVNVTKIGDGEITAYSNNPSIATVSQSGNTLTLLAVSEGVTSITVSVGEGTNYLAPSAASITVTATFYDTMAVRIDMLNSNPETCCDYMVDAGKMTPGSDAWDKFFGHYPVMLKDGVEGKKLDPNDFTKHEDGTPADITSGAEGDVMIAFPRCGLKFSKSGKYLTITMTNDPNNPDYTYMAHKRGNTLKDKFYLGAYKGTVISGTNKLRSLSGKTSFYGATHNIGYFRTLAQANGAPDGNGGSGYDQSGWYQLIYRQCMYILKYKTLNSQSAVGAGATALGTNLGTGHTNTNGMDWGETAGTSHVKLFGLEDFWGNLWEYIDGLYVDTDFNVLTATENFNSTGTGYTSQEGWGVDEGYMKQCEGGTHYGFLPVGTNSGSATTYYCDYSMLYSECIPLFGGAYNSGTQAGAFNLSFAGTTSSNSSRCGRLMYL
jgi:hypothetical protein